MLMGKARATRTKTHTGTPAVGCDRRGFTLLELAVVVSLIGILFSISVSGYQAYRKQALTVEAVVNLEAISALIKGRFDGPIACAPSPAEVPRGVLVPWMGSEGFVELGFRPGPNTRFQYEVEAPVREPGASFLIRARGDLDGDGDTSVFELSSDSIDVRVERQLE